MTTKKDILNKNATKIDFRKEQTFRCVVFCRMKCLHLDKENAIMNNQIFACFIKCWKVLYLCK